MSDIRRKWVFEIGSRLSKKNEAGFTLVETLIYSSLVALFLAFAFLSALGILGTNRLFARRGEILENEEQIERVIELFTSGARAIEAPGAGATSTAGFTLRTYVMSSDPAVFTYTGDALYFSLGGGASSSLTNNRVRMIGFEAWHIKNEQTSSSLRISFTLRDVSFPGAVSSSSILFFLP